MLSSSCSHSVTFTIAAISRESSDGRMTVMSSMNETALAPGTGGLALPSFKISREPALQKEGLDCIHDVLPCVCVCVCVRIY